MGAVVVDEIEAGEIVASPPPLPITTMAEPPEQLVHGRSRSHSSSDSQADEDAVMQDLTGASTFVLFSYCAYSYTLFCSEKTTSPTIGSTLDFLDAPLDSLIMIHRIRSQYPRRK